MREVRLAGVDLGCGVDLDAAAGVVHSASVLSSVHGASAEAGDWEGGRRELRVDLDLDGALPLPSEVRRILCGTRVRATVSQSLAQKTPELHEVLSDVHMHLSGADLVKVRARTSVRRSDGGKTVLDVGLQVRVALPQPFARAAEEALAGHAKGVLGLFAIKVRQALQQAAADSVGGGARS